MDNTTLANDLDALSSLSRRFIDALDRHDWVAVDAQVGGRCTAHMGGEKLDRAGWLAMGQMFYGAFPDARHDVQRQVVQGDTVVTIARFKGTHRGDFMGIPPTNRAIDVPLILVDRYADGKIIEHWGQFDSAGLLRTLTS